MAYRKSDLPKACAVRHYCVHYEVCYIRPINSFLPTDSIGDVNKLSNLVALCPNHHWEFDHGLLPVAEVGRLGNKNPASDSETGIKLLKIK